MQVRATGIGYYGGEVRKPGDVFEAEGEASWFEPVKGKAKPKAAPTQAEVEAGKRAEAEAALAPPPKVPTDSEAKEAAEKGSD